jgi:hypothetical protein
MMTRIESSPVANVYQHPLSKRCRVTEEEQSAFQALLEQRQYASHLTDKQFLNTLTTQQMMDLLAYHGLAHPFQVHAISDEGAANLLAPPELQRDLNGDGLVELGAARLFIFPAPDAPQEVLAAWAELTKKEQFLITTKAFTKWFLQNREAYLAGKEESFTSIYHGPDSDYEKLVDELLFHIQQQRKYWTFEEFQELWDPLNKFKESLQRHLAQ